MLTQFNWPQRLTLFRLAMIPLLVVCFYLPGDIMRLICALLFALAAATDWFDGRLARWTGQVTPLGSFLDPVADKLMVAAVLVLLLEENPTPLLTLPIMLILLRELGVSALREWTATHPLTERVPVSWLGKSKTFAQMTAMFIMLIPHIAGLPLYPIGLALLWFGALLGIWSMKEYFMAALPSLMLEKAAEKRVDSTKEEGMMAASSERE